MTMYRKYQARRYGLAGIFIVRILPTCFENLKDPDPKMIHVHAKLIWP